MICSERGSATTQVQLPSILPTVTAATRTPTRTATGTTSPTRTSTRTGTATRTSTPASLLWAETWLDNSCPQAGDSVRYRAQVGVIDSWSHEVHDVRVRDALPDRVEFISTTAPSAVYSATLHRLDWQYDLFDYWHAMDYIEVMPGQTIHLPLILKP